MANISECYAAISEDPIRKDLGFEPKFLVAQEELLKADSDASRAKILSEWLGNFQPCLFGKIAARSGQLGFSFVTDDMLAVGDEAVAARIQQDKLAWNRESIRGKKSGFVVLALSRRLANARPDAALMAFAQRLAELYLTVEHAPTDEILLDSALLEIPGPNGGHLIRWDAGINVFAAAGDRRWWQDHRMPAGVAFSMNSVGHMVKSAEVIDAFAALTTTLRLIVDDAEAGKVGSLEDALGMAMLTIDAASVAESGKATWLLDWKAVDPAGCPAANVQSRKKVADKAPCRYQGMYHTDHTIPSSYFQDDVKRPSRIRPMDLDFTYLYNNTINNPAFRTMGVGQQIRGDTSAGVDVQLIRKARRQWGTTIRLEDHPEIKEFLKAD
jgi:hypothetical protein